jgi:WS/DGAT/MGAT family acyltransferase
MGHSDRHSDRLTGLDASFLHLEEGGPAHMHVASIFVFEGETPSHRELLDHVEHRLALVPRYRQRLAEVPLGQGRPRWVDDPHLNLEYHVRHAALPTPGEDPQFRALAGRVFAQRLDRNKPLWEIWLVEGLADRPGHDGPAGPAWALLAKTHHALVDGVSGVDLATVLFDTARDPAPTPDGRPWSPRPLPSSSQLLAEALIERATTPREMVRSARALARGPRRRLAAARDAAAGLGGVAWSGVRGAPSSPLNVRIGPHRRYTWVEADLTTFKAIKDGLGGTVNDVVLAAVTGALRRFLGRRGTDLDDLTLRAMVPVSVRADVERGALGNQVAAMFAPLPVGLAEPRDQFDAVHAAMGELKVSGRAVGAQALTGLTGFAPPTILSQAARLQSRQRLFNLVVTNVPGPQFPLYVLGRRLRAFFPMVPLAANTALGIAVMSYDGRLGFGLLGDHAALEDLDDLPADLEAAIADLAAEAGIGRTAHRGRSGARRR